MRLGILGGTFDPIHQGHLQLAQSAYQALNLDWVFFVPAGDPPHKQHTQITSPCHRLAMVALALQDMPQFAISKIDLDRPGPHYAVDMICQLRFQHQCPAETCFFIIGADSLIDFPTWYKSEALLTLCRLAVAHRPGYRPNLTSLAAQLPQLSQQIDWITMVATSISSTQLRQHLAQGRANPDLFPAGVFAYIQQQRLYQ